MKRVCLLALALLALFQLNAQLSDGGEPLSYKWGKDYRDIPVEVLPGVDSGALLLEDEANSGVKNRPYRFGWDHFTDFNLNQSGYWENTTDGRLWRCMLVSSGAISLNLSFKNLRIPEGGKLFVFNPAQTSMYGGFTQKQVAEDFMLGTELVQGDTILVELFEPAGHYNESMLEIWRVTHGYRNLIPEEWKSFGDSDPCNNNVNCPLFSAYANQKRSAICLVNGGEFCSAALINNTCNDGEPYVLTANHCGSSGFGSWVFRFNWEAPACSNPTSNPSSQSISGASNRASSAGTDFRLLEMNQVPPANYNVFYAGWDRSGVPATSSYGIHHPSGDIKKISLAPGNVSAATFGGAQTWQTNTWTDGVTEPGSSGSPLFDQSGRIIGQLYGGPSNCGCEGNPGCGYDQYGRLDISWTGGGTNSTRLSNWLDGCSTNAINLDGYDPNQPVVALDAGITTVLSPSGSQCALSVTPQVTLKNFGTGALTSVSVYSRIDNGPVSTYSWTGNLATGTTANVTLTNVSSTVGNHTFFAWTGQPNGSTDLYLPNDSAENTFQILNVTGQVLPLVEGFPGNTFPAGWTNLNPDNNVGNARWEMITTTGGFGNSPSCAGINQLDPGSSTVGQLDFLVTPNLDLTNQSVITLTFDVANARYNNTYYDSLLVEVADICTGSWARVYQKGGTQLATAPDINGTFVPNASQWRTETVNLSAYAGDMIQVRFTLKSGWGNWTYLDNVNISGNNVGPNLPDANYTSSANTICAGQTVTFTNQSTDANSYQWTFAGGSPASSTQASPTVTYMASGTYAVTLIATNGNGNDTSTGSILVNALPVPVVNANGFILSTSFYPAYQWLLNGNPIGGANQPSYVVTQTGNYSVQVTDVNGCQGVSSPYSIDYVTSLPGVSGNPGISVFPNPVQSALHIYNSTTEILHYSIYDATGRMVQNGLWSSGDQWLGVENWDSGLYWIGITGADYQGTVRFLLID